MPETTGVRVDAVFNVPIADAWALIGDFERLPHCTPGTHDVVVTGSGIGAVRHVPFEDHWTDEQLELYDPANHILAYRVIAGSIPNRFEGYRAEMELTADGPGACRFRWESRFTVPDGGDAEATLAGLRRAYGITVDGLRAALEGAG